MPTLLWDFSKVRCSLLPRGARWVFPRAPWYSSKNRNNRKIVSAQWAMVPRAPSFTSPQSPGDTKRQLWGKEITWRKVLIFNLHGFYSLPIQWNSTQSGIHSVYHLCTIFTRKNRAFFSWRHGGHIGVPNKSCGSWTLFLCKTFFCYHKFAYMLVTWVKTLYRPLSRRRYLTTATMPEFTSILHFLGGLPKDSY